MGALFAAIAALWTAFWPIAIVLTRGIGLHSYWRALRSTPRRLCRHTSRAKLAVKIAIATLLIAAISGLAAAI